MKWTTLSISFYFAFSDQLVKRLIDCLKREVRSSSSLVESDIVLLRLATAAAFLRSVIPRRCDAQLGPAISPRVST